MMYSQEINTSFYRSNRDSTKKMPSHMPMQFYRSRFDLFYFVFFLIIYNQARLSNLTNRSYSSMIENSSIHSPNDRMDVDDEYFLSNESHLLE